MSSGGSLLKIYPVLSSSWMTSSDVLEDLSYAPWSSLKRIQLCGKNPRVVLTVDWKIELVGSTDCCAKLRVKCVACRTICASPAQKNCYLAHDEPLSSCLACGLCCCWRLRSKMKCSAYLSFDLRYSTSDLCLYFLCPSVNYWRLLHLLGLWGYFLLRPPR